HVYERGVRTKTAHCLEQVERTGRIDVEIIKRAFCCQVMTRLGRSVYDCIGSELVNPSQYGLPITDVELWMGEVITDRLQPPLVPSSFTLRPEEVGAHVVVDAMDFPTKAVKMLNNS